MSRKKAFIQAVTFTPKELSALWRACPSAPSSPRVPDPNQLQPLLISRRLIQETLDLTDAEVQRLLRGTARTTPLQQRFDAFMEALAEAFQNKKHTFESNWSSPASTPKTKSVKSVKSTALAVRYETPFGLVDPTPALEELERKMGYDVFENLAALSRACGLNRITLARAKRGRLVRQATLDKIEALGRLATKTIVRRMRSSEAQ